VTTLAGLIDDLDAEYGSLHALVAPLAADDPAWDTVTPAEGWAVRDQISHLAYFDGAARRAVVEPESFVAEAEAALAVPGDPMEVHLGPGRALDGSGLLAWWEGAHAGMVEACARLGPSDRVPWFGPPMGALSFVSARLMETWAHGQDVADALGADRPATDRLRHIAHLGVRARPYSYRVRGREVPAGRIGVDLVAPSGEHWVWEVGETGPAAGGAAGSGAVATISGPAVDFCLVVAQRRHLSDTALEVDGPVALEWMALAQVFAGPPGPGRAPAGGSGTSG